MSTTSPGGYKPHLPNITGDEPADGETVQWDATAKAWKSVAPSGGGGGSSTPGQAAHYIGTWAIGTAYAAGECVRAWDAGNNGWQLCQAKKATTGVAPTIGADNADWTFLPQSGPCVLLWGTEDPNTTDSSNPDGGGGIAAPRGSLYLKRGTRTLCLQFDVVLGASVFGQDVNGFWTSTGVFYDVETTSLGSPDLSRTVVHTSGGGGSLSAGETVSRLGSGSGQVNAQRNSRIGGTCSGDIVASTTAEVADSATGTAVAGDAAIHHAGGEAHVLPTASATRAWNDVKGDAEFSATGEGVVLVAPDTTRHRIKVANDGSLTTEVVT